MDLTTTEPFSDTFGRKAQRKRPRLDVGSISELASQVSTQQASTSEAKLDDTEQSRAPEDVAAELAAGELNNVPTDYILSAGTSRRIWGELYKVRLSGVWAGKGGTGELMRVLSLRLEKGHRLVRLAPPRSRCTGPDGNSL